MPAALICQWMTFFVSFRWGLGCSWPEAPGAGACELIAPQRCRGRRNEDAVNGAAAGGDAYEATGWIAPLRIALLSVVVGEVLTLTEVEGRDEELGSSGPQASKPLVLDCPLWVE
jgi:hypothetical protein